jgi:hypothetical protein
MTPNLLQRYPLTAAHAVVIIISLLLAVALVFGVVGGNISEKSLRHDPPHPSDPVTIP